MKRMLLSAAVLVVGASTFLVAQQPGYPDSGASKMQSSSFSLQVTPGVEIPVGASSEFFKLGGSLNVAGEYRFSETPGWFAVAGLGYHLAPIEADKSVQLVSGGIGGGLSVDIMPRLSAKASVTGGYFLGLLPTGSGVESGGNPYVKAAGGLSVLVSPRINMGLSVAYQNLFGLYSGLGVHLGTSVYVSGIEGRKVKIRSWQPVKPDTLPGVRVPGPGEGIRVMGVEFVQVFPVLHTYDDDNPIGWMELHNQQSESIRDVKVSLYVQQYMHAPKTCGVIEELRADERRKVDLNIIY